MIEHYFSEICGAFGIASDGVSFGGGHINDTYRATKEGRPCVLQRINTAVFRNPDEVMRNIFHVTAHLRTKLKEAGQDAERGTLHFLKTADGAPYFQDADGDCFRVYRYIDNSTTVETVSDPSQFYEAAKAFGRFQNMLSDFPAEELHETIAQFHDTPNRVQQLQDAIRQNACDRIKECKSEIEYAVQQASSASFVTQKMQNGAIPCRVTHNDTKLNNVLFDTKTGRGICVIDLDTVMPGSVLFDFGDALRFGANTAAEDETNLDQVTFDLTLFEAFTEGFASELKGKLTDAEKELLAFSAKLMTYECGIRFLADFLNGDTYFKTKYRNHNLDRAKNQFQLCRDIDQKMEQMNKIVHNHF